MQGKPLLPVVLWGVLACTSRTPVAVRDASGKSQQDAGAPTTCDNLSWSAVAGSPAGLKIMGSGPTDIWLVANNGVMRGDGSAWAPVDFSSAPCTVGSPGTPPASIGLWISGPGDVLVADCPDTRHVDHWDGSQWSAYPVGDNREVTELWGSAPDDVWGTMLSSGYLGHWDGSTWSHVDSSHSGVIGGAARADFWIAGTTLEHHSSSGFDQTDTLVTVGVDLVSCNGNPCAHAVWASSANDVWVAVDAGHLLHFDGSNWANTATPTTATLRALSGSSPSDVWAVGDSGVILHYDGSQWLSVGSPTSNGLVGVWASGPCDVWAIGDAVYHASP